MEYTLHGETLPYATVWEAVEHQARFGDKPFLIIEEDAVSFEEIAHRTRSISAGLREFGVEKGDVVGCFSYNSVDATTIWFACAQIGAIYAPLNVSFVHGDLLYVLDDTRPKLLFIDPSLWTSYAAIRDELTQPPIEVLLRGEAGSDSDDAAIGVDSTFVDLLELEGWEDREALLANDPAAIIYTGGSTGMPKGVLCTHALFLGCGLRYRDTIEATSDDVSRSSHHLFHSGGLQNGVIGPLMAGMTSVMSRWFSASRYWEPVREHNVTVIDPIGTIIAALIRQPESELDRAHDVRVGVCAATGQIPTSERDEFERRFGVPLLEVYAQTETGGVLIVTETVRDRRKGSAGKTWGWGELRIEDEAGQAVPAGELGEICFRPAEPDTFMLEYWNKPDKTVESWRGLWFHSGDVGYLDEDGWLYFIGRQAHWMRRRGENVSAFEVEKVLLEHPDIDECAVVGVPAELGEEDIKAWIVPAISDVPPDPSSVVQWCADRMSYFKVPRYVQFVTELPKSAAKSEIERHKLRDLGAGEAWDREAAGIVVQRPS